YRRCASAGFWCYGARLRPPDNRHSAPATSSASAQTGALSSRVASSQPPGSSAAKTRRTTHGDHEWQTQRGQRDATILLPRLLYPSSSSYSIQVLYHLARDKPAGWRIQVCLAVPAATPALMERVDPNCAIEQVISALSCASAVTPGPSWPKSSRQRSGNCAVSKGTLPGVLSMATTAISCSRAHAINSVTVSWCSKC